VDQVQEQSAWPTVYVTKGNWFTSKGVQRHIRAISPVRRHRLLSGNASNGRKERLKKRATRRLR
jgi:hypothetical protein